MCCCYELIVLYYIFNKYSVIYSILSNTVLTNNLA